MKEFFISGEIGSGGITASSFRDQIGTSRDFTLGLNSPGGSVTEGIAIYNMIKDRSVVVRIDGVAASIASIIAMAARKVIMPSNTFLMVHRARGGTGPTLNKVDDVMIAAYQKRSGKPREVVEGWLDREAWFTAREAKAAGLCDEVTDEIAFTAKLSGFAHPPAALINARDSQIEDLRLRMDSLTDPVARGIAARKIRLLKFGSDIFATNANAAP